MNGDSATPQSCDGQVILLVGFLVFFVLIAALFFGTPLIKEETSDECNALASRITMLASQTPKNPDGLSSALGDGVVHVLGGVFVEGIVKERYPGMLPEIVCPTLYWRSMLNSDSRNPLVQR
jgi:hypothetical protein